MICKNSKQNNVVERAYIILDVESFPIQICFEIVKSHVLQLATFDHRTSNLW